MQWLLQVSREISVQMHHLVAPVKPANCASKRDATRPMTIPFSAWTIPIWWYPSMRVWVIFINHQMRGFRIKTPISCGYIKVPQYHSLAVHLAYESIFVWVCMYVYNIYVYTVYIIFITAIPKNKDICKIQISNCKLLYIYIHTEPYPPWHMWYPTAQVGALSCARLNAARCGSVVVEMAGEIMGKSSETWEKRGIGL